MWHMHNPAHPGQILAYYLRGKSASSIARRLGLTREELSQIVEGRAGISAELAKLLAREFNTDPGIWLRLQAQYDLWGASRHH